MSLKKLIATIELNIGEFSTHYKTQNSKGHLGKSQDIAFEKKPAQQLLSQLGGSANPQALLTTRISQTQLDKNLQIKSFSSKDPLPILEITSPCINKALDSAKIIINTTIFPAGLYAKALEDNKNGPNNELHNQAVAVCHAQIIYPLTKAIKNNHGRSIYTPYSGTITLDNPGLLLLSSPRLDFNEGYADLLSEEQQIEYIEGMYRNLFQATLSEGRNYLAMPAAGLGKSGGSPELYFSALMTIAKEYPELNIIYHPSGHKEVFSKILKQAQLTNVVMASKDIIAIAQCLNQDNKPCALHIPCSTEVILGQCDVGGHWKKGKDKHFTLQEFIGTLTTAPLNSYGFNPKAYQTLVERPLQAEVKKPKEPISAQPSTSIEPTSPRTNPKKLPPTPSKKTVDNNPTGFFTPEKEKYALSLENLRAINQLIDTLQREINSNWPYPNKDLKQEKIDALNQLITKAQIMPLGDAITQIKTSYPRVTQGYFSTRTLDLFTKLSTNTTETYLTI